MFVVTMHLGLCEQYIKSLGLMPSGFDFLFRARRRALCQQTSPEPVLIPLANIVSDYGLAPNEGQAIIWNKYGLVYWQSFAQPWVSIYLPLALKHREKHGCVVSTVATDALVLKHQPISIHNAD